MDKCSGCHIGAFFNSRDEACQVLAEHDRAAALRQEQNLHLVHRDELEAHRARLRAAGFEAETGQLGSPFALQAWNPLEPPSGRFARSRMLAALDRLAGEDRDRRFAGLRITLHMGRALRDAADRDDIVIYEAQLNEVVHRHGQPVVCVYDLAELDGATMMDLLRTHPLTMIGGELHENPFYTPPDDMLRELAARRGLGLPHDEQALR